MNHFINREIRIPEPEPISVSWNVIPWSYFERCSPSLWKSWLVNYHKIHPECSLGYFEVVQLADAWKGAIWSLGDIQNPFITGSDLELPPGFDQHILHSSQGD